MSNGLSRIDFMTANQRKRRLKRIVSAQGELESAILTLRNHFKVKWTTASFRALYYLIALAKKAD